MTFQDQFLCAIDSFSGAIFDNGQQNHAFYGDIFSMPRTDFDLVYIDPPYFSTRSDNDYLRRYHFVEGLCSYWKDVEINFKTKTKKFRRGKTRFDSKTLVYDAFNDLFEKFPRSIFVISYSSNSLPTKNEMLKILKNYRSTVQVKEVDYRYSFGNQRQKIGDNANAVKEYLFIAY